MLPVHRFEHELSIGITIEDQGRGVTERTRCREHVPRNLFSKQAPGVGLAAGAALDCPVADDQRDRRG
jgi:hypothetical protein